MHELAKYVGKSQVEQAEAGVKVADSNLARAEVDLKKAGLDLERAQSLFARQFIAAKDLDDARTAYESARATVDMRKAELQQLKADLQLAQVSKLNNFRDDAPLAVLSEQYRGLHHYFRQNFSQITNPPIDSLRERRVMTLKICAMGDCGCRWTTKPSRHTRRWLTTSRERCSYPRRSAPRSSRSPSSRRRFSWCSRSPGSTSLTEGSRGCRAPSMGSAPP